MIDAKLFPYDGDLLVANAARGSFGVSYDTWSDTPRGPRSRSDTELVKDLGDSGHVLPFRHPHVSLKCVAPIPIARQLGKQQVGFDWSEISRRYKTNVTFHYVEEWRSAPEDRRQGSGPPLDRETQFKLKTIQRRNVTNAMYDYKEALALGATPEQARFLLPQSMEAIWVWTGSLLGWANLFLNRQHADTQKETRDFVGGVAKIMAEKFPHSWPALIERPWR